jgi:hypothetical protein
MDAAGDAVAIDSGTGTVKDRTLIESDTEEGGVCDDGEA